MSWNYQPNLSHDENFAEFEKFYESSGNSNQVCPVCDCRQFSHFQRNFSRCRSTDGSTMDFRLTDTNYQTCNDCGTIMSDTIFPPDYYFDFINNFYAVESLSIVPTSYRKPLFREHFLNFFTEQKNWQPRSVLEVSSFEGATMDVLMRKYDAEVYGLEPTTLTINAAKKSFPNLAANMHNCVFENALEFLGDKKFDMIVFSGSFRQNAHPLDSLGIIENLISDDGYIYLDEGNFIDDCLSSYTPFEFCAAMNQQKNYYYTLNILLYLFEKFGFEYLSSLGRHVVDRRGTEANPELYEFPRHSAVLLQRNQKIIPDKMRLQKSKLISDSFVQLYHQYFKTDEDVTKVLNVSG
jgi:hypothetical protein